MLWFILPVFNEELNLEKLFVNIDTKMNDLRLDYHIILINDGSTDRTADIIAIFQKKMPISVITYPYNCGVGKAFLDGFLHVLKNAGDHDLVVTGEADNTSDLEILENLLYQLNHGSDVVLASCYAEEGSVIGTSLYRRWMSKAAQVVICLFFPFKAVNTYSSFYRLYRLSALRELYQRYGDKIIEAPGFECMVELFVKLAAIDHLKISEVPMILNGHERKGKSKLKVLKTIKGYLWIIFHFGICRKTIP